MNKLKNFILSFSILPVIHSYKFPTYINKSSFRNFAMSSTTTTSSRLGYVDVHCHLFSEKLIDRVPEIVDKSREKGMDYIILNGLEPESNRVVLDMCDKYPDILVPALGIYPLDAACNYIYDEKRLEELKESYIKEGKDLSTLPAVNWDHPFPPPTKFNVDEEIDYIEEMIKTGKIKVLGECGLDKHYLTDETSFQEQERVVRKLMRLSVKYDIPIILHTRKAEKRTLELLKEEGVKKADFHCFCGKFKLGLEIAAAGYYLSIPSAVIVNHSFQKLVAALPADKILTETDSPYMGPVKGEDNVPHTVVEGIVKMAELRGISVEEMRDIVRNNYKDLFGY